MADEQSQSDPGQKICRGRSRIGCIAADGE